MSLRLRHSLSPPPPDPLPLLIICSFFAPPTYGILTHTPFLRFPPAAIINDSYERINDNEACESLRNKLTLIVEAESVLPSGMARRMLERLAQTDLYVITVSTAGSRTRQAAGLRDPESRSPA
jgi:hypothetical protein